MSNGGEEGQSVLCTAIIIQDGKIAIKETERGLALPGGHVDWSYGSNNALPVRVYNEHGCGFWPKHISSILHHRTSRGDPVINLTYVGETKAQQDSTGLKWLTLEELAKETCEPHARRALESYRTGSTKIPLDFVRFTGVPRDIGDITFLGNGAEEKHPARDFVVSGGPLRYMPKEAPLQAAEYAFQECARAVINGQHADNILSFFGGKTLGDELPTRGMLRERGQEGITSTKVVPEGYIGLFINDVDGQKQPARYSANFSAGSLIGDKVNYIPLRAKEETKGIAWLTIAQIEAARSRFRTKDTYLATSLWHEATRKDKTLYPLDIVQRVD